MGSFDGAAEDNHADRISNENWMPDIHPCYIVAMNSPRFRSGFKALEWEPLLFLG